MTSLHDERNSARFLRGLVPHLVWGAGLFAAVWIVEWIVRPHWVYRNAVLAIWWAVIAGPTVFYIGGMLRSLWQNRAQKRPPAPAI